MLPRRPIQTERLLLEPAGVVHAPAMQAAILASNDGLARWMSWARTSTLESNLGHLSKAERGWLEGTEYAFTIARGGEVVGGINLRRTVTHAGEGSLGYWVADAAAGQGYMAEAGAAVVEFGFHSVGLERIELRAHVDNPRSARVAEKIGMRREGRARGGTWLNGSEDAFLYGMIASDPRSDTARRVIGRPADAPVVFEPDFSRGLLTAVAQDEEDGALLMVAHMNEEAYARTLSTGHAWFWSRSREKLWEKGETSGNYLVVRAVTLDCDGDAVLLRVAPAGPACHTGARTCFHNPVLLDDPAAAPVKVAKRRARHPKGQ